MMLKKIFYYYICLVLCLFISIKDLHAQSLYQKNGCIFPHQFGNDNAVELKVGPIDEVCQRDCQNACEAAFSTMKTIGMDLNYNLVQNCQASCHSGQSFTGTPLAMPKYTSGDSTIVAGTQKTVTSSCKSFNNHYNAPVFATPWRAKAGASIELTLIEDKNLIYLCGQQYIKLAPVFSSLEPSDWTNDNAPKQFKSQSENQCFVNISNDAWSNAKNIDFWDLNRSLSSESWGPNDPCKFSARNYNFTDTGIYMADGDFISIIWRGDYSIGDPITYNDVVYTDQATRETLAKCMRNLLLSDAGYPVDAGDRQAVAALCKQEFIRTSAIDLGKANPTDGIFEYNQTPLKLIGEDVRTSEIGTQQPYNDQPFTTHQLSGRIGESSLIKTKMGDAACHDFTSAITNPLCWKIEKLPEMVYMYSGNISDFSGDRVKLGVRHAHNIGMTSADPDNWQKHFGGYTVEIQVQSCPFHNGERMQYAFANQESDIKESDWNNLPNNFTNSVIELTAPIDGTLFFRIQNLDPPKDANSAVQLLYTNPKNLGGYYRVRAEINEVNSVIGFTGFLNDLINTVEKTLFADSQHENGAVKILYSTIIANAQDLISLIRVLLLLFTVISGFLYLSGMMRDPVNEVKVRLLKMGLILLLISDQSWTFFNEFVVKFLVSGGEELLTLLLEGAIGSIFPNVKADPKSMLGLFDLPIYEMFSVNTGRKFTALVLSGFWGFLATIIIGISILFFLLALMKATLMIVFSLLGLALLLIVAPIIIPLILFQITKQLFDTWWRYLVSYALQPAMIFGLVAMASIVFIMLFRIALGFMICPVCLWYLDFPPFVSQCLIESWLPIISLHSGDSSLGFSTPLAAILGCFSMFLVAHTAYRVPDAMAEITVRLITGSPIKIMSVAQPVSASGQGESSIAKAGTVIRKRARTTVRDIGIASYRTYKRSQITNEHRSNDPFDNKNTKADSAGDQNDKSN